MNFKKLCTNILLTIQIMLLMLSLSNPPRCDSPGNRVPHIRLLCIVHKCTLSHGADPICSIQHNVVVVLVLKQLVE